MVRNDTVMCLEFGFEYVRITRKVNRLDLSILKELRTQGVYVSLINGGDTLGTTEFGIRLSIS